MKRPYDFQPETKGDKRAKKRERDQSGPTGGSWAAQAKRAEVNRQYEGVPEVLRPKVRVHLPGEKEKYLEEQEKKKQQDKKKKKR